MENSFVLTFDFGTSGMKISLIDTSLHVVEVLKRDYNFTSPNTEWAQIDPCVFIQAITEAVRVLRERNLQQLSLVRGLILCTQWKGLIPVDEHGSALYDAILWLDKRAKPQADALNTILGSQVVTSADLIPKIVWLRENRSDIYEKTYKFLEINSFITCFATGNMAIHETGHYARSYIKEIQEQMEKSVQAAKIPVQKIPGIVRSNEIVGNLTQQAASILGLPVGLPVYGGLCDLSAVAIGSSAVNIGQSHLYFGTSGWLATVLPANEITRCKRFSLFINDSILRLDGLEAVGLGRKWALELLFSPQQLEDEAFIAMLDQSILENDSSTTKLLSVPLIFSENPPLPEDVFGAFWYVKASDAKRDYYHAVLEGLCFLIRVKLDNLQKEFGYCEDPLPISGGCTSNRGWLQMLADITQRHIRVIQDSQYVGAKGTAACLLCYDTSEASTLQENYIIYSPIAERSRRFDKKFKDFLKVYHMIIGNKGRSEQ